MLSIDKILCVLCIGFVACNSARAQEDPESQSCGGSYPYWFCKGDGTSVIKCSNDPHREPGLIPFRMQEPPCMVQATLYSNPITVTAEPGPQVVTVFNPGQAIADVQSAWQSWVSLCPGTAAGPPVNMFCCIRVHMSTSIADFESVDHVFKFTKSQVLTRSCRQMCDIPTDLYINFSDEFFWGGEPDQTPMRRTWHTGTVSPHTIYTSVSAASYSLRQASAYAFGTHLGLYPRWTGMGCDDPNTIMGEPYTIGNYQGLTLDDICQFKKLYCPQTVGLGPPIANIDVEKQESVRHSLTATPNPFGTSMNAEFELELPAHVRLALFDSFGAEVKMIMDQHLNAGEHRVEFESDGLSSGIYWLTLTTDESRAIRKVVLIR